MFPTDILLSLPQESTLPEEDQHFLLFIPWDDSYLSRVPEDFQAFFLFVLPYLHVRTTDVHTAVCLGMLNDFLDYKGFSQANRRVIGLSLILHDNGWSLLTEAEIAASLGVQGLKLTKEAMSPKEKHAVLGASRAEKILEEFSFSPPLSDEEKTFIIKSVLYHDKPWEVAGQNIPIEVQILVDLDHLWSFTHENFWQDTQRKGIEPRLYIENLSKDLEAYFVTALGKQQAKNMLEERKKELYDLETSSTYQSL